MIRSVHTEEQICQLVYTIVKLSLSIWRDNINYTYFETKCSEECAPDRACTPETHTHRTRTHMYSNQSELCYETDVGILPQIFIAIRSNIWNIYSHNLNNDICYYMNVYLIQIYLHTIGPINSSGRKIRRATENMELL